LETLQIIGTGSANLDHFQDFLRWPVRDSDVAGDAVAGDAALALVRTEHPDVLLLDLKMPGLPAVELVQQIRTLSQPPRVLMLSAFGEANDVLPIMQAGAIGYLVKEASLAEIVVAVRAVARGEKRLSTAVTNSLADHAVRGTTMSTLTPRQMEVLRLAAKGWKNARIARELGIEERTVRSHLEQVFDELDVDNRMAAVVKARQRGWLDMSE
jgi:DNA-binding NarL/FixJ family response regulator